MNARAVKRCVDVLSRHIPMEMAPMGWYFSDEVPAGALEPDNGKKTCMFSFMKRVAGGGAVCFSSGHAGCPGASCYLGFKAPSKDAGRFLAERERFKMNVDLGNAFYEAIGAPQPGSEFVVLESLAVMEEDREVEVVNLWTDAGGMSGLVTLANYDRPGNENVVIPFASGCQSIWTIPYKESSGREPRCVAGCVDPAVRRYLGPHVLSFSMPSQRLVEMADNVSGSFLEQAGWKRIIGERPA